MLSVLKWWVQTCDGLYRLGGKLENLKDPAQLTPGQFIILADILHFTGKYVIDPGFQ